MNTVDDQANWSLNQWLGFLEQQHHKEIDMSLERISLVANALSADRPGKTVITVAGTNGKGSTVRFLEEILRADGLTVGSYTSPHFIHYNERVRVNGEVLDDAQHCRAFAAVQAARGEVSLTYFEFGTLAAFWLLAQHDLDVAVLEIGLGGRLDAVNVIEPDVSIVTSVGIDHIEFLGTDREQIGFEKAGIYRPNKAAICGDDNPPQRLIEHARNLNASLLRVGREYSYQSTLENGWDFSCGEWKLRQLPMPRLPLANAATALAALAQLPKVPSEASIREGLTRAQLPGRLEVISEQPLIILDVAHNPHAAQYLLTQLRQRWPERSVRAVCGMLKDKDIVGTVECLANDVAHWYCATTPGPRGLSGEALGTQIMSAAANVSSATPSVRHFANVKDAYESARTDASGDDIVLCFGSFLTIQAIYQLEG